MRYAKGHGTGNDFIVVPDIDDRLDLGAGLVRRLCDRHTGIGADGVLRVVGLTSGPAAWFMDYRNSDGSIAEMFACGSNTRKSSRAMTRVLKFCGCEGTGTRVGAVVCTRGPAEMASYLRSHGNWDLVDDRFRVPPTPTSSSVALEISQ
jgi:hypothetical protein